jgi:hypothetical protein
MQKWQGNIRIFFCDYYFITFHKLWIVTYFHSLDPIPNEWNLDSSEHASFSVNTHCIVHTQNPNSIHVQS